MISTEAVGKENVVIRAGACAVTLLPHLGGKIASIRVGETELLQAPLTPYAPRTRTMGFDQADASGWDECLPSVAACTVYTSAGAAHIPDHGDLWRVAWLEAAPGHEAAPVTDAESLSLTLAADCFSLPLSVTRTLTLTENSNGWQLHAAYSVTNSGYAPTPWSWAAHPLFTAEAGDRIQLPESIRNLRIEGSGGGRLGKGGDTATWPVAVLADGSRTDLSLAQGPDSAIGDKLFAGPLAAAENWCALERPKAGLRIKVRFNPEATPYLGLWICYGGWPERPGPRQVCVALEPTTAPVDSLAATGPWSRQLAPGESFSWSMTVEIELLQDGKPHA